MSRPALRVLTALCALIFACAAFAYRSASQDEAPQDRSYLDFTGVVLDERDRPVQNARISLVEAGNFQSSRSDRTGKDGRFSFEVKKLPATISISADGYRTVYDLKVTPGKHVQIRLRPAITIEGSVLDADTGEPIPAGRVTYGTIYGSQTVWQDGFASPFENGRYRFKLVDDNEARLRILAPGYLPLESDRIVHDGGEPLVIDVKLTRAKLDDVVVLQPDGVPAAGAEAVIFGPQTQVMVLNGRFTSQTMASIATSDEHGRLPLALEATPFKLLVLHDSGFALLRHEELFEHAAAGITLVPWAWVDGRLMIGTSPGTEEQIQLRPSMRMLPPEERLSIRNEAQTDEQGRFILPRVLPGDALVSRQHSRKRGQYTQSTPILAKPVTTRAGEPTRMQLGGIGRPVIARLVAPQNAPPWRFDSGHLRVPSPEFKVPFPPEAHAWTQEQKIQFHREWLQTPEGMLAAAQWEHETRGPRASWGFVIDEDLRLRAEDVEPGEYELTIYASEDNPQHAPAQAVLRADLKVTIPPADPQNPAEPFDLGEIRLVAARRR